MVCGGGVGGAGGGAAVARHPVGGGGAVAARGVALGPSLRCRLRGVAATTLVHLGEAAMDENLPISLSIYVL